MFQLKISLDLWLIKQNIMVKKNFWRYCLQCFSSSRILEDHIKNGLAINHTKSVSLPHEVGSNEFKNLKILSSTTAVNLSQRQRVGYQSNQKLLHHYQHAKNQLNS